MYKRLVRLARYRVAQIVTTLYDVLRWVTMSNKQEMRNIRIAIRRRKINKLLMTEW